MPTDNDAVPHDTPAASKRSRRKSARPSEIVEAALQVFVEKGFAATRIEEVARCAGVAKATVFVYFPTKEALFKAVVRAKIVDPLAGFRHHAATDTGTTRDLIVRALHEWWTRVGGTKAGGISKLMMQEAKRFPELASFYQSEVLSPATELMAEILQRGVNRGELRQIDIPHTVMSIMSSLLFLSMWSQSYGLDRPFCGEILSPQAFIDHQINLLFSGIELKGSVSCA